MKTTPRGGITRIGEIDARMMASRTKPAFRFFRSGEKAELRASIDQRIRILTDQLTCHTQDVESVNHLNNLTIQSHEWERYRKKE
jgi:hypothetical protein